MKATDDDLRAALGISRPRGGAGREACPSSEAIAMHAEGGAETVGGGREVLDHMGGCADCALEYRLASSLKPWADGASVALRSRTAPAAPARFAWLPSALAASLLLVGLGGWNLALRRQGLDLRARLAQTEGRDSDTARRLAEKESELLAVKGEHDSAPSPAVNVPIVDLDAGGTRGARGAGAVLRLPAGTSWATFVLDVTGGASTEAHSLEIRGGEGRVVWRGDGLVPNAFGTFTLAVPGALLPSGRYRFVLSRKNPDGTSRVVQTYRLQVLAPEP